MYNARIKHLRTELDKLLNIPQVDLTPAVIANSKEMDTELAGLLADRSERIATRIYAQVVTVPTWRGKLFTANSNEASEDRRKLALFVLDHTDALCAALDKANS